MRKIYGISAVILAGGLCSGASAQVDPIAAQNTIIVPSQSSVYNQNSVNLPTAPQPNGQDIVRSSGGTSCQSAVSTNNPYLDIGVIGSDDVFQRETQALYGRLVVPLGPKPRRVDCTRLYELEIARLSMELEMMKLAMPAPARFAEAAPAQPSLAEQAIVVPSSDVSPETRAEAGMLIVGEPEVKPVELKTFAPPASKATPVAVTNVAAAMPVKETDTDRQERTSGSANAMTKKCRFYAQLGSFMSRSDAERAWGEALTRKSGLLQGHRHAIMEYESKAKTYYRLRAGPLSQTDAQILCERIDSDCFVVTQKL